MNYNSSRFGVIDSLLPSASQSYLGSSKSLIAWKRNHVSGAWTLNRIWIGEESYLRKGYGTMITQKVLKEYCLLDPKVTAVLVDPTVGHERCINFINVSDFGHSDCEHFGYLINVLFIVWNEKSTVQCEEQCKHQSSLKIIDNLAQN